MRRCAHKHLEDRRARVVSAGRGLPRPDDLLAFAHQRFDNAGGRLKRALEANTRHHRSRYERCAAKLSSRMLKRETDRLKELITRDARRLERCMHEFLRLKRRSIETSAKLLNMLSHRSVLQRGFALVTSEGSLIADAAAAAPGMQVTIEFHDASVGAHIEGAESRRVKLRPRKKPSDAQGSLL
jgi:exodeoxyribonuclease VII large subunit